MWHHHAGRLKKAVSFKKPGPVFSKMVLASLEPGIQQVGQSQARDVAWWVT